MGHRDLTQPVPIAGTAGPVSLHVGGERQRRRGARGHEDLPGHALGRKHREVLDELAAHAEADGDYSFRPRVIGNCERIFSEAVQSVSALDFVGVTVTPQIDRWADDAVKVPRVALDETLNVLTQTSFVERLKTVTAPTLVVGGVHDPILTPQALRETVVAPLPKARLVLLDCNHEIPIEQPRELAGLIGAFLAGTQ